MTMVFACAYLSVCFKQLTDFKVDGYECHVISGHKAIAFFYYSHNQK
jgi:hypothetical protein